MMSYIIVEPPSLEIRRALQICRMLLDVKILNHGATYCLLCSIYGLAWAKNVRSNNNPIAHFRDVIA